MTCNSRLRQRAQGLVDQIRWRYQGIGQRIKSRLTSRERFPLANKLKPTINRLSDHIREIIKIKRRQVFSAILHAKRTERPAKRITAILVDICI